ncbi:HNH endonuclease [Paraburkholderia sp. SOS3]|uniref:HNH endonuclease n=1 Tax=Paraburkholderia sp. SOS3 TaxID=1926494 RepID=UPI0009473478|nr:HNH endonuclease [Paraburkholderia sp. SOS3]APR39998.1 hypothetical protein BTO02_33160 [Paraburkholderia sp. SOS3]
MKRKEFDYDMVREAYLAGSSLNQIASEMGLDDEDVRRALIRMGVPRRPRGAGAGQLNHQFKGGTRQRKDGYLVQRGNRAKQLEHRVIAEKALGRPLKRSEDVHHVNFDGGDNGNTNLVICTHTYHMELHARMRRHPYWSQVEADYRNKQRGNK